MSLVRVNWIEPGDSVGARRGEVVVAIPVYGGHEHFVACLRSVLAHTPAEVPIVICDDASPDRRSEEFVRALGGDSRADRPELFYMRRDANVGFPANVNAALVASAPADLVILNSDCMVAERWVEGLRDAAYHDTRVATATPFTNNGTIVSVPGPRPSPTLPEGWTLDEVAASVRGSSLKIRPWLPTAVGHCMLIRRSAVELVGDFDVSFSPGYGEEVDFSQRCLQRGLGHVLADEVFVFHHGGASLSSGGERNPVQDDHERVIAARYPYYHPVVREVTREMVGPLRRAVGAARRAISGLSVIIDARILGGPMTGTQLQVLEVVGALARSGKARLTVVLPERPAEYVEPVLGRLDNVRLVSRSECEEGNVPVADVVHRPYQVSNEGDVSFLVTLGERLIVTNQDLISYHNPSYFRSFDAWRAYRHLTRTALAVADHVVFVSAHARQDALDEELVEPGRGSVVHNGVDHSLLAFDPTPMMPRPMARVPDESPVILCLGTNFKHKNRVFALRLLEALQRRHRWPGYLVLAGPYVADGGSGGEEAEFLALRPELQRSVVELAAVTEAEKVWLYRRSQLVLYPSTYEGFGLVPFEAAKYGVPCMWASVTSMAEVLPAAAGGQLVPWDPEQSADRAVALLEQEGSRSNAVEAVRGAAHDFTWDVAAARLIEIYGLACDAPATPGRGVERGHGFMSGVLSEDAMRLVGPGGVLPPDVERPLLALATHPQVGEPMFKAIKFGYRASYAWRRRLRRDGRPD
jgi:glycosyltransferase involved in cell wall biosynthesis